MTMQTARPLPELQMGTLNTSMYQIKGWADSKSGGLVTDQPYQRGNVWGVVRQRNLIRSALMGVPIPSLIFNDRFSARFKGFRVEDEGGAYAVVDGKQRVTTILCFYRDEFAVPASWWQEDEVETTVETEDGPYVTFSGLSRKGQGRFDFAPIGVCMGRFPTLAGERFVFDLVNFGGVPQGERDNDAPEESAPVEHVTTDRADGSVDCSCGVRSQRFGLASGQRRWAREHKRNASA